MDHSFSKIRPSCAPWLHPTESRLSLSQMQSVLWGNESWEHCLGVTQHCLYFLFLISVLTADFGDFNRYDSQDFLQKFALFPIVSIFSSFKHTWNELMNLFSCKPYLYQTLVCRTGFRMNGCWRRPLRKWKFSISRSGERFFQPSVLPRSVLNGRLEA